jgi:hypothetical protein
MRHVALRFVRLLHIFFIVWLFWAPFSGRDVHLVLHAITAPAVLLHWWMNNDTCALTFLEAWLRGVPPSDTFFDQLVGGVYRLPLTLSSRLFRGPLPYLVVALLAAHSARQALRRRLFGRLLPLRAPPAAARRSPGTPAPPPRTYDSASRPSDGPPDGRLPQPWAGEDGGAPQSSSDGAASS